MPILKNTINNLKEEQIMSKRKIRVNKDGSVHKADRWRVYARCKELMDKYSPYNERGFCIYMNIAIYDLFDVCDVGMDVRFLNHTNDQRIFSSVVYRYSVPYSCHSDYMNVRYPELYNMCVKYGANVDDMHYWGFDEVEVRMNVITELVEGGVS